MTPFRFPLEKALGVRRVQLELAEARVEQQLGILAGLTRERQEIEAAGRQADAEVREFGDLAAEDLHALGGFRERVRRRGEQLAAQRTACEREVAVRQAALLEARRRCRLLEKLRERRWVEWQAARDRELEALAADSYLARWTRQQA